MELILGLEVTVPAEASTAFFRRIAEEAPVAVAMAVVPDGTVVYANRAYRALLDDGAAVIGATVASLFPGGDDMTRIGEAWCSGRTVTARGLPRLLRPGQPSWWDEDIHPLPDPDGSIPAVLIMAREVTGHVQARQEADAARAVLARQAEQLRLAINTAGMFFWDWDIAAGTIEWSDGLEAACGLAPGSFEGTLEAFQAMVHPDDIDRVGAEIARALAGEADYDAEFRMRRADGGLRWVSARGTVLRDAAGQPVRMIGIDLDITRRRLAEDTWRSSEERLRLTQEAAKLGMWEYHPVSRRSVLSAGYRAIHGLDEAAAATLDFDGWLALV
ncbi:MAG: PAS domain S-box protein, partial [Acetobacteraceae bacterium]